MFDTIDGVKLYYEVYGSGSPILMLHGFMLDTNVLKGCMEPIFEENYGWKRIYVDLPGMGKSGKMPEGGSGDKALDLLLGFIEKVIPEQSFLIVGESYGGYLAQGVLSKLLHRVEGMMLICPVVVPGQQDRCLPPQIVLERDETLIKALSPEEYEDFNSVAVIQNQQVWSRYQKEVTVGLQVADNEYLTQWQTYHYGFTAPLDEENQPYEQPILILTGRQDGVVGYQDAWQLLEKYPRASFAVLDRAGHNLQIEQDRLFSELAKDWLGRVKKEEGVVF